MLGLLKRLFEAKPEESCIGIFYRELGGAGEMSEDVNVFLEATLDEGILYNWDWREGPEDIVGGLGDLLRHRGMEPVTEEAVKQIMAPETDKEPLPKALSEADALLIQRGYRLLSVDTRSDQYCAAIVTEHLYRRWVNVRVANDLMTRDHHRGGGRPPRDTAPRDVE